LTYFFIFDKFKGCGEVNNASLLVCSSKTEEIMKAKNILSVIALLLLLVLIGLELTGRSREDERDSQLEARIDTLETQFDSLYSQPAHPWIGYEIPDFMSFCGLVDLRSAVCKKRVKEELIFLLSNQGQMTVNLKRSGEYFPWIERILTESGACRDLRYVVVIESSFRLKAVSSKEAAGPWQFLADTAKRRFGLRVDQYVDERLDPELSTRVAVHYFDDLMEFFDGDILLALTGYYAGEDNLLARMRNQKTGSYWKLDLPYWSSRYASQVLACKLAFENKERFGFVLPESEYYQPTEFQEITIKTSREFSLVELVEVQPNYSYKEFKDLNPKFLKNRLPAGIYSIRIPLKNLEILKQNLPEGVSIVPGDRI
jgi:hypothetical protein